MELRRLKEHYIFISYLKPSYSLLFLIAFCSLSAFKMSLAFFFYLCFGFAPKSSHAQIFFKLATEKGNDILSPKRPQKIGGSLADHDEATVSVRPKILQQDLSIMFSGPIK